LWSVLRFKDADSPNIDIYPSKPTACALPEPDSRTQHEEAQVRSTATEGLVS
jgi:hypothetical protein